MKSNKNKGMFLETIINNSIYYYEKTQQAIFRKQSIPIKVVNIEHNVIKGLLEKKCDVDYYGIYQGKFIAIEAKQTNKHSFSLNQLLPHQIEFLKNIKQLKGFAYIIVYFQMSKSFYLIEFDHLWNYYIHEQYPKKSITETWFQTKAIKLEIIFPGRLNFLKHI